MWCSKRTLQPSASASILTVHREILDGTGESWEKSYTSASVDELIEYLATIKDGEDGECGRQRQHNHA